MAEAVLLLQDDTPPMHLLLGEDALHYAAQRKTRWCAPDPAHAYV